MNWVMFAEGLVTGIVITLLVIGKPRCTQCERNRIADEFIREYNKENPEHPL